MFNNDYQKMLVNGEHILQKIMPNLNKISNNHIRLDKNVYRREEDCKEIAIALALYDEYIESLLV